MVKINTWLLLIVSLAIPWNVSAKLNVFACEPEWESLAHELGGDKVSVFVATVATQDPHHIEARPSLIAKMRRAQLLVCTGADLEVGWLPLLLRSSANSQVHPGQPGYFEAAMMVDRLDIPESVDRSMGDVHAKGNPHVHLDPGRIALIAEQLTKRLVVIDGENKDYYQKRGTDFQTKWQNAMQRWQTMIEPLNGIPIVVHHKDWAYLIDWIGLKQLATLEPKPGVPPSTGHLAKILSDLKVNPAKMIMYSSYQDSKPSQWLSEKTGIKVVKLPYTVGGSKKATDLESLIEDTLQKIIEAAK